MKTLKNVNRKGTADFDERSFWKKLQDNARTMGYQLVLRALELFYAMVDPATPLKAKLVIAGALAYLVLPVDLIPDFLPGGYADDATALLAAYKTAEAYITPAVTAKAREKADALFRRSSVTHKSTASC